MTTQSVWWSTIVVCVIFAACSADAGESLAERVDQLIDRAAGTTQAPPADDCEFCRRVYLDLAGRIPTVAELDAFLSDSAEDKRARLIDGLLDSPDYPRRLRDWAHVHFMERLGDHPEWLRFLETAFAENRPWNQVVRDILNPPDDDESRRGAALFLTKRLENYGQNPVDLPGLTRDVGRLFLGVDLQCAQCHDHLFIDDYKQIEFQGLHTFLAHTFIRQDVKFPAIGEKVVTTKTDFMSVFLKEPREVGPRMPFGAETEIVRFEKGDEFAVAPDKQTKFPGRPKFSPLAVLADSLPTPENRWFTRNAVNRWWYFLMGRGLVHPLDLQHAGNPASHPELLDLLAEEFAAHEFDVKWLLRELARTRVYQRSSRLVNISSPPPAADRYLVALEKPLSPEQLAASMWQATGHSGPPSAAIIQKFVAAFGNPPREPEGEFAPSVKAALYLSHDAEVLGWTEPGKEGLVARLLAEPEQPARIDLAWKSVLSRAPDSDERSAAEALLSAAPEPSEGPRRLVWALLNTTEFCVNH